MALWVASGIATVSVFAACGDDARDMTPEVWRPAGSERELHPVTIAAPSSAGKLTTPLPEIAGSAAAIGCPTCHAEGAAPAFAARRAGQGEDFHAEVEVQHADLACASCHVPGEPHRLRASDGDSFPIRDSMRLCSQCHGPIRKAFDHGAHGGMRGYWDRQRGPRTRNTCITCHDPHSPDYPLVTPVEGPKDRFMREHAPAGSLVERRYGAKQHE